MKNRILKLMAIMFAVITVISVMPLTALAAPASDIPKDMLNNPYLDALAFTGYKVQAQKDDGTIFKVYSNAAPASVRSGIGYGTGPSGLETTSAGLPDIEKFKSQGLCCASYVSYVLYNYLPNVAHISTSSLPQPSNPRSAVSYNDTANIWVQNGNARRISFTQNGSSFTPSESIPIGSVIIFKNTSSGAIAHVALYAGFYGGQHFVTHVGSDNGPEFCTIVGMTKGSSPETVVQIVAPQLAEPQGIIEVNKKDTNGKNLSGAIFIATNNSTGIQYPIGPTDDNGYAKAKEGMPFGTYTVRETVFPTNYTAYGQSEWTVTISAATQTVTINAVNTLKKGTVKVIKTDSETGKTIPCKVTFKIKNLANGQFSENYTTNEDGTLTLSTEYEYGSYELYEVKSTDGYLLNTSAIPFAVNGDIELKLPNKPQKGKITIEKKGEVFASITETDGVFTPVFEEKYLANAVFNITAKEDIVTPDGTVRLSKGAVADTVTTNAEGKAETKELYLGKYLVSEVTAPNGTVLNKEPQEIALTYAGETVSVTKSSVSITNERQKASVSLKKVLESDNVFKIGENGEIQNVKFGLFASEDLTALDGSVIPKDGLLEVITPDENGNATFTADIPVGAKLYVKEIATDEHYILSDTCYPVSFEYAGQDKESINIFVNDGQEITNEIIRGNIAGLKTDEKGKALEGAVFGLFKFDETSFEENNALMLSSSDKDGNFGFFEVPFGRYIVKEISGIYGYKMSKEEFAVNITENDQTENITCINEKISGTVTVNKLSAFDTDIRLSGAEFEVFSDINENGIFDIDTDLSFGKLTETEVGKYQLSGLKAGKYFLLERTAPKGYVRDIRFYPFEISEENEDVILENKSGVGFLNTPINPSPKTGDNTNISVLILIMIFSASLFLIVAGGLKKEYENR